MNRLENRVIYPVNYRVYYRVIQVRNVAPTGFDQVFDRVFDQVIDRVFDRVIEPVLIMFPWFPLYDLYRLHTTTYYSQTAEFMSQICTEFCAILQQFSDSEPPRAGDPFAELYLCIVNALYVEKGPRTSFPQSFLGAQSGHFCAKIAFWAPP